MTRRPTTEQRRSSHFQARLAQETSPRARLARACDYLRAAAQHQEPEEIDRLATELTRIAERLNQKGEGK